MKVVIPIDTNYGTVSMFSDGSLVCGSPDSTAVSYWVYMASTKTLAVQWGERLYHYQSVPFDVIHEMMLADSLGSYLNKEVKPKYEVVER